MFHRWKMLAVGLAAAAVCLGPSAAMAYPATATASVNVRSGPGPAYRIVDQLYAGERVNIVNCRFGWCYVDHRGPDGWVAAAYLGRRYLPPPVVVVPPVFPIAPPIWRFPFRPYHHYHHYWPRGHYWR